jgi:hypothetical protein
MEEENKDVETVLIKGFDGELQGLPKVASQFARFNPNDRAFDTDTELKEIVRLSKTYLKILLTKAIKSHND